MGCFRINELHGSANLAVSWVARCGYKQCTACYPQRTACTHNVLPRRRVPDAKSFSQPPSENRPGLQTRVGRIMLCFLPIMLFLYAQNSTDYALNYAPKLRIMLKLCSLFLEGANFVCSNNRITLLCTTSQFHHQSQTRPSRSYHLKTHEDEILGTQLVTRHSLRARLPVDLRHYAQKLPIIPT